MNVDPRIDWDGLKRLGRLLGAPECPTLTAMARAIAESDPPPEEWFVTSETMALLKDEARSIRTTPLPEYKGVPSIVTIRGVRIVEMKRDA